MGRTFDAVAELPHILNEIKRYFVNNGNENTKAVIGISGGKDSTIAAALLVRALGKDRVIGVMMPEGTQKDIHDSQEVCDILDIEAYTINIGDAVQTLYGGLIPVRAQSEIDGPLPAIVTTNTPARIRMATLYAVAGIVGGRVIHTGNASEMYVGYTTKYGDMAGDFSIFKDYYVREVLALGNILEELPPHLVNKAPGDGMSGKTDEDNFGFSYEALDAYILDNVYPDYDTLRKIEERHDRNLHKSLMFNIPYIRCKTRKWENYPKHGGAFEVLSPFEFEN